MVKTMQEVVVRCLSPALTPVKMAWLWPHTQTLSCLPGGTGSAGLATRQPCSPVSPCGRHPDSPGACWEQPAICSPVSAWLDCSSVKSIRSPRTTPLTEGTPKCWGVDVALTVMPHLSLRFMVWAAFCPDYTHNTRSRKQETAVLGVEVAVCHSTPVRPSH